MGTYFDFLANVGGDPPPPKKKPVGAMPGGTVDEFDTSEYPTNRDELFAGYGPKSKTAAPRAEYTAKESELVRRESAALNKARAIFGRQGEWTGGGDSARVRQALASGRYTPEQLASDLDVIIKRKGAPGPNQENVEHLAALRNELGQLIEDRAKFSAIQAPALSGTMSPDQLSSDAKSAKEKAEALEREAAGMGVLTRDKSIKEAKDLRAQALALEQRANEAGAKVVQPTAPDAKLEDAITANGMTKKDWIKRASALASQLAFNMHAPLSPGAGPMAIVSMMSAMGPAGERLLVDWYKSMRNEERYAPKPAGKGLLNDRSELETDPNAQRALNKQAQLDAAIDEFKRTNAFSSMWHVLAYVMFAMMMGPKPAMILWSNKSRKGELQEEVDMLANELKGIYDQQARQASLRETARHHAALESVQERRFQHQRDQDADYLELRRSSPRGKDPQYEAVMDGYRNMKDERDDLMDKINNSYNFSDEEIAEAKKQLPMVEFRLKQAREMLGKIAARRAEAAAPQTQEVEE